MKSSQNFKFFIPSNFFSELQKKGERQISVDQAEALVSELKLRTYKECSALTGEGLKLVFDEAVVVGLSDETLEEKRCLECSICTII